MTKTKGFDGLRGISVLLVIMSHIELFNRLGFTNPVFRKLVSAEAGVDVFFILSGFLITLLLTKEQERTGTVGLFNFYMRRTLRIFPLYFLAVSIVPVLQWAGYVHLPTCSYVYAYTYMFNFVPKTCTYQTFGHFWSLAVEEHFYIFWPLIFLMGRRVAIAILLLFAVAAGVFGTDLASNYAQTHYINRWTFPAAAPIAFGCIAAYLCRLPLLRAIAAPEAGLFRYAFLALAAAGIACLAFPVHKYYFITGMTMLILYVYFNQASGLVRVLEFRPLAYIGLISYGLYVWQGVLTGNGPYRQFPAFPPPMDVGAVLTFIVAPISYHFFEKPIMRFKRNFRGA